MIFYACLAILTIGLALAFRPAAGAGNVGRRKNTEAAENAELDAAAVGGGYQSYGRVRVTRRQAFNFMLLSGIFLVLAGTAALRLDVGNDYGNYVNTCHEIYVNGYVVTEPGFNMLVKLLYMLSGGENYLLVFGLFGTVTVFVFMKAMVDQSLDFSLSFALFMLLGLYFRTFNTMRYYLALAITLYSMRYVLKREYVKFLLLIGLAALFHKSVLVVIPLYAIAALPWKKWQIALGGVGCACLALFQELWMKLALYLYPSYKDTVYLEQGTGLEGSLAGIVRCGAVLVLTVICYKEAVREDKANLFYSKLNLLGLALYTCASFLPLVSRFGYYLITAHILLVPGILKNIKEPVKRKRACICVWIFSFVHFIFFLMTAHQAGVRVLPYQSWVFTTKEWLNGSGIF